MKAIRISIPTPCHENWNDMTPTQKGRFCAYCEKEVLDFTVLSDAAILSKVTSGEICARVSETQLNRTISSASDTRNKWMAAGFASVFALMSQEAVSQKKPKPAMAKQKTAAKPKTEPRETFLYGQVCDGNDPVPDARIFNKRNKRAGYTDESGKFRIVGRDGDSIFVYADAYLDEYTVIREKGENGIAVCKDDNYPIRRHATTTSGGLVVVVAVERRSFFGRVFQKIGSWFK